MASVFLTFRIMPESPDISLEQLQEQITQVITTFGGRVVKIENQPVAFGLIALQIIFALDESKGSTDSLEQDIQTIAGVQSVDVVDVRRVVG